MYKPKTYKSISSAKRAGRTKCLKNGWLSYIIARFGDIIMAAGPDERREFDRWVNDSEILFGKNDISLHLVYPRYPPNKPVGPTGEPQQNQPSPQPDGSPVGRWADSERPERIENDIQCG